MAGTGGSVAVAVIAAVAVALAVGAAVLAGRRERLRNRIQVQRVADALSEAATALQSADTLNSPTQTPSRRRGGGDSQLQTPSESVLPAHNEQRRLTAGVDARVEARFKLQQLHYERALDQSTTYFYVSMVVGVVGLGLVAVGAALALTNRASAGTVTALAGVIGNATAAMIFSQASRAKRDSQTNLAGIARSTEIDEKYLLAFLCASRIEDQAVRDSANAALARALIGADLGDRTG
ncbi:TRADD-N-associated membrane domain-containing protein [Mycobacterium sp. 050134]|uniref:TRADD-N-associated membrane domain-containing protein n=1 Tax=Mycobacterium sp. 050134 TaxID=3096111 RepID=UPI002EDA784F